jgi:hypothetical protein
VVVRVQLLRVAKGSPPHGRTHFHIDALKPQIAMMWRRVAAG